MKGRTYRYLEAEPLYPFGYGLSYTTFQYSELTVSSARIAAGEELEVSVVVSNAGARAGDEVVQLYVKDITSSCSVPTHDLRGFQRITLQPRESRRVHFRLSARDLSLIDEQGRRLLEPGQFRISVGGSQPDARSVALTGHTPLSLEIQVTGAVLPLPY
jgi:beta-glucosidase